MSDSIYRREFDPQNLAPSYVAGLSVKDRRNWVLQRRKWDQEARLAWLREKVALAYGEYELVDTTVSENHESKR